MANMLSRMFGLSKKGTQEYGSNTVIPSLTNVAGGETLLTALKDRLAGRGVGLGIDANALAKPYADQRMAQLKETEIPGISAQASSRGLGRSTIPVNRIGMSTQAAGRDIASRTADLDLMNQQQKRLEIQNALSGLQSFVGAEGSQQADAARLATGIRQSQLAGESAADAEQMAGLQRLIQTGVGVVGGAVGGGMGLASGTGFMSGAMSGLKNASTINSALGGQNVNIGDNQASIIEVLKALGVA